MVTSAIVLGAEDGSNSGVSSIRWPPGCAIEHEEVRVDGMLDENSRVQSSDGPKMIFELPPAILKVVGGGGGGGGDGQGRSVKGRLPPGCQLCCSIGLRPVLTPSKNGVSSCSRSVGVECTVNENQGKDASSRTNLRAKKATMVSGCYSVSSAWERFVRAYWRTCMTPPTNVA